MARALCIAILAIAISVNASRDQSAEEASDSVGVSVGTRSFLLSKPELHEAMRLELRPEQERLTDSEKKMAMDEAATHLALQEIGKASKVFSELQNHSMALRRGLSILSTSEGLTAAADKAASVTKARSALRMLAQESMRVKQMADELDEKIQTKYSQMLEEHVLGASMDASKHQAEKKAASLAAVFKQRAQDSEANVAASNAQAETEAAGEELALSEVERKAALDHKFQALAGKTETLLDYFDDEIKTPMLARDQMKAKEAQVLADAGNVGLTHDEMEQELSSAHEALDGASAVEHVDAGTPAPTTTQVLEARMDPKIVAKNEHLQHIVMASAMEMAAIGQAANDVISGLVEVNKWRQSHDGSVASNERGAALKAKLDKATDYLATHEGSIHQQSAEIDELMRAAGMPAI